MTELTKETLAALLPRFAPDRHKGDGGRVLMAAGSYGLAGAAALCAEACYRCGAGIVDLILPPAIYPMLAVMVPEAVFHPTEDPAGTLSAGAPAAAALAVGCGLGCGKAQEDTVNAALRTSLPLVLDADGLNAVAGRIEYLTEHTGPLVITPHPGEAARLLGTDPKAVNADRPAAARALAVKSGGVAVLKGHGTLIAAGEELLLCPFGNPGMAKGGSGDLLTGMIASFLAQGLSARDSAVLGVGLHALAGDEAAAVYGETAMLPRDLLAMLPVVLKSFG